jgi:hypothetical protein
MKILTTSLLALSLALAAGCGKKDEKKEGGETATKTGETTQSGAALKMSAADFYKDYTSLKGMELMDKYGSKTVEVSGKLKKIITEMDESTAVWMDVDGTRYLLMTFKDKGAAFKGKGLAEGADFAAACTVGGGTGNYIMLIDCEMK